MPANVKCEADACIHCNLESECKADAIEVDDEGTCLTYNEGGEDE